MRQEDLALIDEIGSDVSIDFRRLDQKRRREITFSVYCRRRADILRDSTAERVSIAERNFSARF